MKYATRLTLPFLAFAFACGGEEEHEEPDVAACTHIQEAASPLTASATRESAPAIAFGESPYEVTLDAAEKTYVAVTVAEAKHGVFYLSAADVATGKMFLGQTELALEASSANEHCAAAIPDHYHLELDAAGTYAIELSPSAVKVKLLLLEEDEDAHAGE